MKKALSCLVMALGLAVFAAGAQAITFSNVTISGDLSGGAYYVTGSNTIDFYTPNAGVGDPYDPKRFGELVITYEAESSLGMFEDKIVISILGGLSGSGIVFFNEVVEDLINPGIIGTDNAVLDKNSDLPYTNTITFDRATTRIKVKKSFLLSAEETRDFDLAKISLVEQTIGEIPEPATLSLLGLAAVPFLRRLRK